MKAKSDDVIQHPVARRQYKNYAVAAIVCAGKLSRSVGSRTRRTLATNDAAPRLCGHWLHGLSSKVKASIDGCVMHDRLEWEAVFGRFCLRSTASGMSLVGTFAWTGRALQAECEEMEGVGLAHLYPRPLLGSFVLLCIMDIRANEIVD